MALLDRLRGRAPSSAPEQRAVDASDFGIAGTWHVANATSAGEAVDVDTAMRAAMGAAIRLIADDIAALPWKAYRKKGDGRVEITPPVWMDNPSGHRWDYGLSHVSDAVVSLLSDGNVFVEGNPSTVSPRGLAVLDPKQVIIERGADGFPVYRIGDRVYGADKIAHVAWLRKPGELRGIDMVDLARESTGLEIAARRWAGNFFHNGATLGGVVQLPVSQRKTTADELAMMKRSFEESHGGNAKSFLTGFLTNGAQYKETNISPREAELAPLWDHVLEEACRLYHVPTHLLASTSGSNVGANVEQRSIEYVTHAIVPVVARLEAMYSRLLPGPSTYVRFNVDALLRGDAKARAEASAIEAQNGIITRDEWRAREDLSPAPEGEGGYLRTPNNQMVDPRYEQLAKLVQAGFDPEESLASLGLPAVKHLGNLPTTLYDEDGGNGAGRPPESDEPEPPEPDDEAPADEEDMDDE